MFEPDQVVVMVKQQAITTDKVVLSKEESIRQYLEVRSEFCHHWTLPDIHVCIFDKGILKHCCMCAVAVMGLFHMLRETTNKSEVR